MKKHVPLKATVCFSVYNGSFLLKERPVGFKGKMHIYYALIINHLQIRKIKGRLTFPNIIQFNKSIQTCSFISQKTVVS